MKHKHLNNDKSIIDVNLNIYFIFFMMFCIKQPTYFFISLYDVKNLKMKRNEIELYQILSYDS